jgi:hypothetical protein
MWIAALMFAGAAGAASAGTACDPAALFARVRAATGGAAWSNVGEIAATGAVTGSGLRGTTRVARDVRTGRGAVHDDLGLVVNGLVFDGRTTWQQDGSLGVHRLDAPFSQRAAVTDGYLRRNGFFRPADDPAAFQCLGVQREGPRRFDVVEVTPKNGRAVRVWIDRASALIDRTVQRDPIVTVTVFYADYRLAGALVLPFEVREDDGDPSDLVVRQLTRYELLPTPRDADFTPPPAPRNQRMLGGARATTVPIETSKGTAVVEASIDGHSPMPFLLDSGGHAIFTAEAARALGLRGSGHGTSGGGGEGKVALQYTRTKTLRVGNAELRGIPFLIIPYDKSFSDRGPGRAPLAGILGVEMFERFAIRIDYAHAALTLTPPETFRYRGPAARVPVVFAADVPLAPAAADGFPGLFQIDTGNAGSSILFNSFLKPHGFFARYGSGVSATGRGTGGTVELTAHRVRRLSIGGYDLDDFITQFAVTRKGAFSSLTEAGNVGFDVLSQFTPTFDYAHSVLYLERRPGAPLPLFNRTGIATTTNSAGGLRITGVLPASPAGEAGLAAGDDVLTANGIPATQISPARMDELGRGAVATQLALRILHGGAERVVTLTLRDILCSTPAPCAPHVEKTAPGALRRTRASGTFRSAPRSGYGRATSRSPSRRRRGSRSRTSSRHGRGR